MSTNAKKNRQSRRFWESLSDEALLLAELSTDDPEALPDLVAEVPDGDEEPYVEYKYDLRKTGREEFKCVHGHHRHLAGYVMRKGDKRFLVGWICGNTIYGEDFERYTADFNAAVNRQDALRRAREVKDATGPFMAWLDAVMLSDIFERYESVRDQLAERMEGLMWVLEKVAIANMTIAGVNVPPTMFLEDTDPQEELQKLAVEISSTALLMVKMAEQKGQTGRVAGRLDSLAKRIDAVLDKLKEIEDFFQPNMLAAVCEFVTEHDNPKKRKYEPGLMCITCKRDKKRTTVHMPRSFKTPSRAPIEAFRKALTGLQL